MNIREIVADWLRQHGYDGLYDAEYDCACTLDALAECHALHDECVAGVKIPSPHGDGDDWDIGPKPEEAGAADAIRRYERFVSERLLYGLPVHRECPVCGGLPAGEASGAIDLCTCDAIDEQAARERAEDVSQ